MDDTHKQSGFIVTLRCSMVRLVFGGSKNIVKKGFDRENLKE